MIVKDNFLRYGKSFPITDTARSAPCKPHIESQGIDLELIADSIDAIQDNEFVYVDELPDGNPYFVASHGLPTFENNLPYARKRPLVDRCSIEYEDVETLLTAPSTSYSSHFSHGQSHVTYPKSVPIMPVFKGAILEHRDYHPILGAIEACVARPVSKKERLESAGARASLEKEWDRLRNIDSHLE